MDFVSEFSHARDYYIEIEELTEVCFNQDDLIVAQALKVQIEKTLLNLLTHGLTRPKMRLFGKFVRLEIRINRFIISPLRQEYVELDSPDEED